MTTEQIYLRPAGRITQPPGRINVAPDEVLRLFDRDDAVFAALEVIQRGKGWSDRRLLAMEDARAFLAAQSGPISHRCKTIMDRLTSPRRPVAGLSFDRPRIMGVVNVTPDSFADGGRFLTPDAAVTHALQLEEEGADILDIGGESTRPGADPVSADEELRRVMPVIEGLVGRTRARISIDTRKADVMRRAALAGVHILNDVSALQHDALSMRVAAETRLPVVLMHALGDPRTMQRDPRYDDVLLDVYDALEARVEACARAGIARDRLIVDPGIGFGKTAAHNFELLSGLSLLHGLGVPLMLGASRKSFIGAVAGAVDPSDRLPGSLAAALAGAVQGVQILRVHDVAATRQALTIWEAAIVGTASTTKAL
jgi:dihydropteroate synthase